MKTLTVFTPTYNRAFCLGQLYESLCRQTSRDFLWLIIDDGSTDNTSELVARWQREGQVEIRYHQKPNGGMHTGHNAAYKLIDTPLNTCIDSDDFMPDDAVDAIVTAWDPANPRRLAGIIGLDAYKDGKLVGTKIPENITRAKLNDLYFKHGVTGDKKVVLVTDVVKKYPPYPEYPNEKLVPLGTLYKLIDKDWDFLCLNKVLCVVEYLPDGSSRNIFKQYRKSPNGFFYSRLVELAHAPNTKYAFTRAMHLVSSAVFAGRNPFKGNPRKLLTLLALPAGLVLHAYIWIKSK
ncbi:MAG TPA: glycosyltransferase family A protein [Flavobacterium sp.]|nr:glycosyltransferase family A protein [Flavobacterium sp.]